MHSENRKVKKIFYGWLIVVVFTVTFFSMAANPFSIILKKLMTEFGCGRGVVSLAISINTIAQAIAGLYIGRLLMHHKAKNFMIWGTIISGASLLLLGTAQKLPYFFMLYFINGLAMSGAGVLPVFMILSKWFNRKWGTVVGISMSGFAIGSLILSPVIGFIAADSGWRMTYFFAGILMLAVNLPLIILFVKENPESMDLFPDGDNSFEYNKKISDNKKIVQKVKDKKITAISGLGFYFKKYQFWLVGFGFAFVCIGDMAVTQHQVSLFTDMKISETVAATAFGLTMGISGVGRLIAGWLSDRIISRYISMIFIMVTLAGVFILMRVYSVSVIWIFVIVYGMGTSASTAMLPIVIRDVFGAASFSILFAVLDIFYKAGSIIGTPLAGFIFDATGSYNMVLVIVSMLYVFAILSIYLSFGLKPKPFFR